LQPDVAEDDENLINNETVQLTLSRDLNPDLLYHFELDPELEPPVGQPFATLFAMFSNDLDPFPFATSSTPTPYRTISPLQLNHSAVNTNLNMHLSPVTETQVAGPSSSNHPCFYPPTF
jgi:hypothetical protein